MPYHQWLMVRLFYFVFVSVFQRMCEMQGRKNHLKRYYTGREAAP